VGNTSTLTPRTWYQSHETYDIDTIILYANGALSAMMGNIPVGPEAGIDRLFFKRISESAEEAVDKIRMGNQARRAKWIKLWCHNRKQGGEVVYLME
jgi:hypothetical protein